MNVSLSESELERYGRQMMLPKWGKRGQKKLKSSEVVVVGTGGLGCPASIYLAAAGFGRLVLIDKERFELSNLNRQILGWQKDVGRSKAEAAAEKLGELNSEIEVKARVIELTENNVHELLQNADVVIDGMDNWRTRFIINKECVENKIPFIHAGIFGLYGQITTIIPGKGPCLRCILPETPKEITRFPVPGATPSLFASLQVMEALKLIVGFGEPLVGRMLLFDGERMSFTTVKMERHSECPLCSHL
ncbi:MAG: HesA/MoeB/ThiF family protein [Candidatus Bathyarchaeota archaeon]|nr:MAG: HesA/MoeB/ThiF family protein [Candidatus Bathyarchaeota archaeon]